MCKVAFIPLVLFLLIAIVRAISVQNVTVDERFLFRDYVNRFSKKYTSDVEYETRFLNFKTSLLRIREQNLKYKRTTFALNQFSDMSVKEFRRFRLMPKSENGQSLAQSCLAKGITLYDSEIEDKAPPSSFDWRTRGVVTPVKDQGQCGSCWAFSTIANVESQWALQGNKLSNFSEQLLVDCSTGCSNEPPYGPVCNQGCDGGWQWNAFFDIMSWGGVETEAEYPYTATDGTCNKQKQYYVAPIKNYTCITSQKSGGADETKMAAYLVSHGPISIALNADLLMDYSSGIVEPSEGDCDGSSLDHALLIVGYGVSNDSTPYWIVKNSWSSTWGEDGYFRIVKGKSACGLNNAVSSADM